MSRHEISVFHGADDVQSIVIPGTGHFLAEESPDELLAALTPFPAPYRGAAVADLSLAKAKDVVVAPG